MKARFIPTANDLSMSGVLFNGIHHIIECGSHQEDFHRVSSFMTI